MTRLYLSQPSSATGCISSVPQFVRVNRDNAILLIARRDRDQRVRYAHPQGSGAGREPPLCAADPCSSRSLCLSSANDDVLGYLEVHTGYKLLPFQTSKPLDLRVIPCNTEFVNAVLFSRSVGRGFTVIATATDCGDKHGPSRNVVARRESDEPRVGCDCRPGGQAGGVYVKCQVVRSVVGNPPD